MKLKNLILSAILLFLLTGLMYGQTVKEEETDGCYIVKIYVNDLDSAETGNTVGFNMSKAIQRFLSGNLAGYTLRDTTVANYVHSNSIYAKVLVDGAGTADSLSLLTISGLTPRGTWVVWDTLNTAKAVTCQTEINFTNGVYYTDWRINWTVADLTVSMYDGELWIDIIIPKPYN